MTVYCGPDGLQVPSYTTVERDALAGLQQGEFIYNSTKDKYEVWTGSIWTTINF